MLNEIFFGTVQDAVWDLHDSLQNLSGLVNLRTSSRIDRAFITLYFPLVVLTYLLVGATVVLLHVVVTTTVVVLLVLSAPVLWPLERRRRRMAKEREKEMIEEMDPHLVDVQEKEDCS